MNDTNVRVKVCKSDRCIYENNNTIELNANNLSGLITCLKDTQIEINDFLTSLVEKHDDPANVESK